MLRQASVLVIGAGGLGCPALLYLASSGIGHIGIVDHDCVDESNLQRQILYNMKDIGKPKTEIAGKKLEALNPGCVIDTYQIRLDRHNVGPLVQSYDLIIDGSDNYETKYILNDACAQYGKPLVYAALHRFRAQIGLFDPRGGGACYRCLYPSEPMVPAQNCREAGVLGPVAGMAGTVQATEAIKYIIGHDSFETLKGRILVIDGKTMTTTLVSVDRDKDCKTCSKQIYPSLLNSVFSEVRITEMHAGELCMKASYALLVDVRELDEWDEGRIPGATHFPLSKLQAGINPQFKDEDQIIVYCLKGIRSLKAAQILKDMGYTNIVSLEGGFDAWLKHQNNAA